MEPTMSSSPALRFLYAKGAWRDLSQASEHTGTGTSLGCYSSSHDGCFLSLANWDQNHSFAIVYF